jgi:hypothetical protein
MSDPTFQMVILQTYAGMGFAKTAALEQTAQPRTFDFGLPADKREVKPVSFDKTASVIEAAQPRLFTFFYPSNGKTPGSPIPRVGQVSPRPL